jgi:membrane-associated phospholipid phosphatase
LNRDNAYPIFNKFFIIPFVIWMIGGGVALLLVDKEQLFRLFNTNHTPWLDILIPFVSMLGEGLAITIIFSALLFHPSLRTRWYIIGALACPIISALLTQAIKSWINAPRPLTYFNKADWIHILPGWKEQFHRSFPSGHTCGAFAMFCFLSCLLPARYRPYGIAFFLLALMVGYSRMYLAAHFFADIYAGSFIGVLFTTFMLLILRRYQSVLSKEGR